MLITILDPLFEDLVIVERFKGPLSLSLPFPLSFPYCLGVSRAVYQMKAPLGSPQIILYLSGLCPSSSGVVVSTPRGRLRVENEGKPRA